MGPSPPGRRARRPRRWLSGQHEDYLHKALTDYQSGKRKNAIMQGMAAPLAPQDIADLAAYFASQAKGLTVVGQD